MNDRLMHIYISSCSEYLMLFIVVSTLITALSLNSATGRDKAIVQETSILGIFLLSLQKFSTFLMNIFHICLQMTETVSALF